MDLHFSLSSVDDELDVDGGETIGQRRIDRDDSATCRRHENLKSWKFQKYEKYEKLKTKPGPLIQNLLKSFSTTMFEKTRNHCKNVGLAFKSKFLQI